MCWSFVWFVSFVLAFVLAHGLFVLLLLLYCVVLFCLSSVFFLSVTLCRARARARAGNESDNNDDREVDAADRNAHGQDEKGVG